MLDYQGKILFPDDVEVIEMLPRRQFVYPIFKNGSSSLYKMPHRVVAKQDLSTIENITVFVRNPHERFLSGVQTYIDVLGPNCDVKTVLQIISQNLYLNRHFCPQLYWILNLKRFTSATLTILPIEKLSLTTDYKVNRSTLNFDIKDFFDNHPKILFYNEIDEVLTVNLIGKTVTFEQIFLTLEQNYTELYHDIFKTARDILNALPKT
jgi:hypothetical protein